MDRQESQMWFHLLAESYGDRIMGKSGVELAAVFLVAHVLVSLQLSFSSVPAHSMPILGSYAAGGFTLDQQRQATISIDSERYLRREATQKEVRTLSLEHPALPSRERMIQLLRSVLSPDLQAEFVRCVLHSNNSIYCQRRDRSWTRLCNLADE